MKDKILFESKYTKTKLRSNWYELTSSIGTNEIVAVLFLNKAGKMLVRYEDCPPYYQKNKDKISMVALTGMREEGESPLMAIQREIFEESGITRNNYIIKQKGWAFANKQSDLKIHFFVALEKTNSKIWKQKIFTGAGDGTKGEKGSYAKWVSRTYAKQHSRCGVLQMLLCRNWNN